jgi:ABC-type Zn uptake system ZnuABC Zn-binding protein ZnuA
MSQPSSTPPSRAPRGSSRPALRRALRPTLAVAAATVVLAGCGSGDDASGTGGSSSPSGDAVQVVVTTSQLGDIVREVGGSSVDVHQILSANTDPHEYEPRPSDVTATAGAKVVFASGLGLDDWVADVQKQSGTSDAPLVKVGDTVPTKLAGEGEHAHDEGAGHDHAEGEAGHDHAEGEAGHDHAEGEAGHDEEEHAAEEEHAGHDHGDGEFDAHWWHDPKNVEHAVGVVRDALVKADPDAADAIRKSASAYLTKVQDLDAKIEQCVSAIPKGERKLVTSHDAFGYFAHRYDITVVGAAIPSQTTRAQPSAQDVARLTKVIRDEQVKAIFPESSVNPKLADAIAKETGASSDLTLYGDTLGPDGSDGDTYLGMEAHNADAVVRGLTGKAKGCDAAPTR